MLTDIVRHDTEDDVGSYDFDSKPIHEATAEPAPEPTLSLIQTKGQKPQNHHPLSLLMI